MLPTMRLAIAVIVGLVAIGCAGGPVVPAGTGPLVTVTTRGGECFDGPCGSSITIERDGSVHEAADPSNELGTVPADVLTALDAAVKTTDFDVVRSVPFTGECPVNFDGQEWIYEFGAPGGVERIATCETEIDPVHPVFATTNAALVAVGALPGS